ncbi:MAG: cyanophycinase [Chitinophagaceae bacterium]
MKSILTFILLVTLVTGCKVHSGGHFAANIEPHPGSLGYVGDITDVKTKTRGAVVLMGGGKDVDSAFKWMIERSGGGNAVVIRASGTAAYNPYIFGLGKLKSVETLLINTRALADDPAVAQVIRNAELLWIAGGDQADYMKFWKGTRTSAALNYLLNEKKVPFGGTSAGCAILGGIYYSGEEGSIVSDSAMINPFDKKVTLYNNDFLHAPFLRNVITDQHYLTRNREGRHVTFLARIINDWKIYPIGIAANEKTAVCIDDLGHAKVIGDSKAYFIISDKSKTPEIITPGRALRWVDGNQALRVYEIQGTGAGKGYFPVNDIKVDKALGGEWYWWWTENGKLFKQQIAVTSHVLNRRGDGVKK